VATTLLVVGSTLTFCLYSSVVQSARLLL